MKTLVVSFVILICCLFTFAQEKTVETKAKVFFYRVKEVAGIDNRKAKVTLDGVKLFEMPQVKWIGFEIAPGKYALSMRQKQSEILLKAEAGKTYFIRVSEKTGGFTFNQSLTLMDAVQAVFQMRDLPILESKRIFIKTAEVISEKPVEEENE